MDYALGEREEKDQDKWKAIGHEKPQASMQGLVVVVVVAIPYRKSLM